MSDNLESCPFCGGEPKPYRVGDWKQFYVYKCSRCGMTPVRLDEARLTMRRALVVWNMRAKEAECMRLDRAIEIMETEKRCVIRASANLCDRDCGKCDLVLPDNEIIEAYNIAIGTMKARLAQ